MTLSRPWRRLAAPIAPSRVQLLCDEPESRVVMYLQALEAPS